MTFSMGYTRREEQADIKTKNQFAFKATITSSTINDKSQNQEMVPSHFLYKFFKI